MSLYLPLSLAVICLMAADVATGATFALGRGEFQSREMRRGFWRKCAEIFALFGLIAAEQVATLAGVDLALPFGFIGGAGYISAMEAASIVENLYGAATYSDKEDEAEQEEGGAHDGAQD